MGAGSSSWTMSSLAMSGGSSTSLTYDCYLPEDIWIEILSFVPSSDLLKNCLVVCHQWKDLVLSHGVWKRKCLREGRRIPAFAFNEIPKNFYRMVYIHNPFGRNLIKNPCGEEDLKHWAIHSNHGDGWKVENPPVSADPVPQVVGSQSCFSTSYGNCLKYQLVDLLNEGVLEEVMAEFRPPIYVEEWHAARFDCGSVYRMTVALLDEQMYEVKCFEFGPYKEEQWTGKAWSKVSYVFKDYPPGVRYVGFEHFGQDTQFWAGNYGSKMTGSYLSFNPP